MLDSQIDLAKNKLLGRKKPLETYRKKSKWVMATQGKSLLRNIENMQRTLSSSRTLTTECSK